MKDGLQWATYGCRMSIGCYIKNSFCPKLYALKESAAVQSRAWQRDGVTVLLVPVRLKMQQVKPLATQFHAAARMAKLHKTLLQQHAH